MKKIREFIKKYGMATTEDYIIAGISGGADSVCQLFVLLEQRSEMGVDFAAVHVNHGLRGAAADSDEAFETLLFLLRYVQSDPAVVF